MLRVRLSLIYFYLKRLKAIHLPLKMLTAYFVAFFVLPGTALFIISLTSELVLNITEAAPVRHFCILLSKC